MTPEGDQFPPPPTVSASEEDLVVLGQTIAEAINSENYDSLESEFSLDILLERAMWPTKPTVTDYSDFAVEVEKEEPYSTRVLRNWLGWGTLRFLRVRQSDVGTTLMFRAVTDVGSVLYAEMLVADNKSGRPVVCDVWTTSSAEYLSRLLRIASGIGNPFAALKRFLGREEEEGESETSPYFAIRDLYLQGEFAEALRYYENLPEWEQRTRMAQLVRLNSAVAMEQPKSCSTAATEARALFPNDVSINISLFEAYYVLVETDSAMVVIDRIDAYAHDPYLDVLRGSIVELEGDVDRAAALTLGAIDHDSTLLDPYYRLHQYSLILDDYGLRAKSLAGILSNAGGDADFESYEESYTDDDFIKSKEYGDLKRRYGGASGNS